MPDGAKSGATVRLGHGAGVEPTVFAGRPNPNVVSRFSRHQLLHCHLPIRALDGAGGASSLSVIACPCGKARGPLSPAGDQQGKILISEVEPIQKEESSGRLRKLLWGAS